MRRKTKIICTIGPASESPEKLRALMRAGMNVARLNFSHGTHEEHAQRIRRIRGAAQELGLHIGIMLDTKGPEIRTGLLKDKTVFLESGDTFILTTRPVIGNQEQVQVTYSHLPQEVKAGDMILLSDGLLSLQVQSASDTDITCKVMNGGVLGERKGVNIPGVRIELPFLSGQDKKDIIFGIEQKVDFIAASFVRSAQDILDLQSLLESYQSDIEVIAKIESQRGVENLEEIIQLTDGVMVARGDLGVEVLPEEVPLVQRDIISRCSAAGKTVIVATQMLDSMIYNPRPTRAEISDVANAVFDGADAIMLSGETAAGKYPVEAAEMMHRIAAKAESSIPYNDRFRQRWSMKDMSLTDAISYATCSTAIHMNLSTILTATRSGNTARMVAKYRPKAEIIAVTASEPVCRRLSLVWGVEAVCSPFSSNLGQWMQDVMDTVLHQGYIKPGDMVAITAGEPNAGQGGTNLFMVKTAGRILLEGRGIGHHPVSGRTCVVKNVQDVHKIQPGDIVVCVNAGPEIGRVLSKLSGLVAETGGLTSDAAVMGIAAGIPVITGVEKAVDVLNDDMEITLDPSLGRIYAGKVRVM